MICFHSFFQHVVMKSRMSPSGFFNLDLPSRKEISLTIDLWYVVMILLLFHIYRIHFNKIGPHFYLNCTHVAKYHIEFLSEHKFWSTLKRLAITVAKPIYNILNILREPTIHIFKVIVLIKWREKKHGQ